MPRRYKRKPGAQPRAPVDEIKMKLAVEEVLNAGKSIRGTAKSFDLSVMTLKRYVRKTEAAQSQDNQEIEYKPDYRKAQVFDSSEEADLTSYLETASKLYHGLSPLNVRKLAYEYACENSINFPPKWHESEAASYDWFYGFMSRHKTLSLRVPEATSLARATAFNKHNVGKFFANLRSLMERFEFRPEQIWNIDETGLTNVHKPRKIVACRGMKQVSKVTSGERGELVTVCGAINALGNHLPPFMIFPRKNWQKRMTDGGPPGTEGAAYPSGWMTGPNFVVFLNFFVKHVKCSKENPCLMVLDNHESHITVEAINFAKSNGIHLLTIPPHTSQKLQPLDRILFGTLKTFYNTACDDWMVSHPGRPMTIYEIAGCLGKAYPTAMTPRNIQKSFKITGICPFDSEVFTEDEYLSSYVTDRENPQNADSHSLAVNTSATVANSATAGVLPALSSSLTLGNSVAENATTANTPASCTKPVILENNSVDEFNRITNGFAMSSTSIATDTRYESVSNIAPHKFNSPVNDSAASVCSLSSGIRSDIQSTVCIAALSKISTAKENHLSAEVTALTFQPASLQKLAYEAHLSTTRDTAEFPSALACEDFTTVSSNCDDSITGSSPTVGAFSVQQIATSCLLELGISSSIKASVCLPQNTENYSMPAAHLVTPRKAATPTTSKVKSFQDVRPYPKASPRKTSGKGRKRGSTRIVTDTPEKEAIEAEYRVRQELKDKKIQKTKVKQVKRKLHSKKQDSSTSEDEELPPASPESDLVISSEDNDNESSSESENDEQNGSIKNGDWLIINLTSQKNLVHRFIGQVQSTSVNGYKMKFAKKMTEKVFKWPPKDDFGEIMTYQVVKKLPRPKVKSSSRRVLSIEFPKSLRKFKIE